MEWNTGFQRYMFDIMSASTPSIIPSTIQLNIKVTIECAKATRCWPKLWKWGLNHKHSMACFQWWHFFRMWWGGRSSEPPECAQLLPKSHYFGHVFMCSNEILHVPLSTSCGVRLHGMASNIRFTPEFGLWNWFMDVLWFCISNVIT